MNYNDTANSVDPEYRTDDFLDTDQDTILLSININELKEKRKLRDLNKRLRKCRCK